MILLGVDPHKSTHTATAVEPVSNQQVGSMRIEASLADYRRLLAWAKRWPQRKWAVENANGPGRHLAQWLIARGESVVDVPAAATSRVRELSRGGRRKNDQIDAAAAATVANLQGEGRDLAPEDHTTALALLDERRVNLAQARVRTVNQLHALLRDLLPGGAPTQLSADLAAKLLRSVRPAGDIETVRKDIAWDLVAETRKLDKQLTDNAARMQSLVEASSSTLMDTPGIGPVMAARLIGRTGRAHRFSTSAAFANYAGAAPVEIASALNSWRAWIAGGPPPTTARCSLASLRMTKRGWRLGVVAVLAAICISGPGRPEAIRTAPDLGPLPADRYDYTPQDYQRSQRASALLVRQCMAERGHSDFPLDPRYPSDPVVATAVSTDYGALDLATARRWGYGWDPAKSRALRPTGRRMTNAEYADFPACNAEASRRLMRGINLKRDWLYASTRAIGIDKAVKRDPRLRAAWDVWSRCVAEQGFRRYPDPVAAYTDTVWQRGSDGNTRHTQRERATAVADVTCKRRHHTAELWHAARARKQAVDITRHRDHYAAGLQALRTYRATIAEVLRRLG